MPDRPLELKRPTRPSVAAPTWPGLSPAQGSLPAGEFLASVPWRGRVPDPASTSAIDFLKLL